MTRRSYRHTAAAVFTAVVLAGCSSSSTDGHGAASLSGSPPGGSTPSGVSASGGISASTPDRDTESVASSAPAPVVAADVDPCSLVMQAEADRVAGAHLMKAARALQTCTFAPPAGGSVAQFQVFIGDGAKKAYDIDHDDLGHVFKSVPGIGDEAHLEEGAIFFRSGDIWVQLALLRLDDVDTGPGLTALARTVAGRL